MNKLSIITVTYNAEQTLERTLKSVRSQSYSDIEHIVVDGKSTDNTISLIKKLEGDKMKWISEPDQGLYDAMNKGIKMATGDYLCFLNAGDTFFNENTVKLIMQSNNTADIFYGETAIVDINGKFLHMRRLKTPEKLTWRSFKQGMLVCHQAFIVRREIAEPYDLSYHFSSDFDWSIRMLKKSETIINTNHILINYLNEGMTTTNRSKSLKERYLIMVKHYGHVSTLLHHLWFLVRFLIK
ncbi:MAG: glycosyltransferase family 2 protein [Fermentimonas sp.]|jgi:glycosyltransferase involved in cell wall biosynthesis|nr:glycosyltransferase family 2 protein [Fermentimonas sp.]NLC85714.1 glycosyltransferase [Bacteroidales bacterium]HBT84338.1 glycosyl transferase [Porphyromonadaceae bacterium]MDD2930237.1 glycosyltransferase family 2 protein [Fermentimonas sp.]MDD3188062.1 glycosyltransferase family 2 protein [Fermentimonas sp.]